MAFNLTPPTETQRRQIIDALNEDERHVLLQHGTEAAFCGVFLDNKPKAVAGWRLLLLATGFGGLREVAL